VDFPEWIANLITTSPLAGVLLYIWLKERSERVTKETEHREERRQYASDYKELHERTLKGLYDAAAIASAVVETFGPEQPPDQQPPRRKSQRDG
jgi:hypothetical protein